MTTHCLAVWLGWRADHAECLSTRLCCSQQARENSFFSILGSIMLRCMR